MTIALVEEARIVRKLSGLLGNLYFQPVSLRSFQFQHLAPIPIRPLNITEGRH